MITWREAMSVGSPALDADHKKLIELINLTEQWGERQVWPQVAAITEELMAYVQDHFRREEAVQAAIKFPDAEIHRKGHDALGAKTRLIHDKFKVATTDADRQTCVQVLGKVLNDWLIDHILKQDMKYKPFIPKKAPHHVPLAPSQGSGVIEVVDDDSARRARLAARDKDIEYELPPHLAHLLKRLEYAIPDLEPPARGFDSFEKLCEAAICRRIDKVLVFFQRRNPAIKMELPTFFLASPEFAGKFRAVVSRLIFPTIWNSRQIRLLATNYEWKEDDTDSFWQQINRQLAQAILAGWTEAWTELKLVEVMKGDQKVFQVKDATKQLREMLAPDEPESYDIPKIGNREIETFMSLLDPANDWWETLNRSWRICHDLYEQEKDPRIFQQKAREGALRDNLLAAFNRFPPEWVDFLVLACHRVFPRITTSFLEGFSTNLGRSEAEREAHIPYTIRYLRQARDIPQIKLRERQEEEEWRAQMKTLSDYLAHREPAEK
jgi:hemerythrin-like metal-binding protein